MSSAWDYVIVGGGAAGCLLANRLSAGSHRVLLVEAGADTPPGAVPADIEDIFPRSYSNDAYMWPGLEASTIGGKAKAPFPQGRVMGGGSSIMGMLALRGVPEDYDGWRDAGATGWSWAEVLPYFRRLESDWDFGPGDGGKDHGTDGPIPVRRHHPEDWPLFTRAIGTAAASYGLPLVHDMNADFRDGHGRCPLSSTLTRRISSAAAFLDATTRARPNLEIRANTQVERLRFEGTRCIGIVTNRDGLREEVDAREVILSAGGLHSPTLLLRSGVGPAAQLARHHITPVAALEGVGQSLQNHPVLYLATHVRPGARQSPYLRQHFLSCIRMSSDQSPGAASTARADTFMLVLAKSSWGGVGATIGALGVAVYSPHSRGRITLNPGGPSLPPDVDFAYLSDPRDRAVMEGGLRRAVDLMLDSNVRPLRNELFVAGYSKTVRQLNAPGRLNEIVSGLLARTLDGPEWLRSIAMRYGLAPGEVGEDRMTEPEWLAQTVAERTFGMFHPTSSCRMGPASDPLAVVDPAQCRVHGTMGLRVIDASVMPRIVRGNTNFPTMMIAEKTAEAILRADR